jgi:soluble lytic murein transglycosylase-like protein
MRILKPIAIGAVLTLAQLSAYAAQIAVLRNGFSIRFERKEQNGNFEADEAPVTPEPQPAAQPATEATTATSQPATQPAPAKIAQNIDLDQVVREASTRNRIDPDFVSSVIKAESNFKTRAVSKKGAQGLMQLMPQTAAKLGVADPFDPRANVEAGTAHLSALLDQYHDDPIKALAAYNAGAHRVQQYNGVPPYRETHAYIRKIVSDFNAKKRAQMKAAAATKAAAPAKAASPKPAKKAKPQQASVPKPASPA